MSQSSSGAIKAIDRDSVHRLCSAQVVVSLAIAVKEVVENALDAGATTIEVRFKESGLESIEVSDNGSGIHADDFEALALKHTTSKIRAFDDLMAGVDTYGFRGEALSSLCALADVSVVTRHETANRATRLVYGRDGHVREKCVASRQVGTTVTLSKLFAHVPIRRQQLASGIKREFSRAEQLLTAYALVRTGVRFCCTNVNKAGKLATILLTQGKRSMKETLVDVFGPKLTKTLVPFVQADPDEETLEEFGVKLRGPLPEAEEQLPFSVVGFVSSCRHGEGRAAGDKVYFFVDSRPCDLPQVGKVVRSVYQQFNRHQLPFVCLDVQVRRGCVDVNLTPDKRKVLLHAENLLQAIVKASLLKMYGAVPTQVATLPGLSARLSGPQTGSSADSSSSSQAVPAVAPLLVGRAGLAAKLAAFAKHPIPLPPRASPGDSLSFGNKRPFPVGEVSVPSKQPRLDSFFSKRTESCDTGADVEREQKEEEDELAMVDSIFCEVDRGVEVASVREQSFADDIGVRTPLEETCARTSPESPSSRHEPSACTRVTATPRQEGFTTDVCVEVRGPAAVVEDELLAGSHEEERGDGESQHSSKEISDESEPDTESDCGSSLPFSQNSIPEPERGSANSAEGGCAVLKVDWDLVVDRLRGAVSEKDENDDDDIDSGGGEAVAGAGGRRFHARIDPRQNAVAEQELSRQLDRGSFARMRIVGQFNRGFVLARAGPDVFIVDQHASDEKSQFERLQATTRMRGQRLVVPKPLELTVSNESVLVDNIDVFRRLGYDFLVDEGERAGRRVRMTQVPLSKNCVFGSEEVEELIFQLSGGSNGDEHDDLAARDRDWMSSSAAAAGAGVGGCGRGPKPAAMWRMFAYRACHSAVRVGTDLTRRHMRRIVDRMGEMDNPWNCPHGRPTIRHLLNLDLVESRDEEGGGWRGSHGWDCEHLNNVDVE